MKKVKMWRIEDDSGFKSNNFWNNEKEAICHLSVFKESFAEFNPVLKCYLVEPINDEELKKEKIRLKKDKDYEKDFSNYILKLKKIYGNNLSFSQIRNADFDLLCKLYVQFKYEIPVELIEKNKKENKNGK